MRQLSLRMNFAVNLSNSCDTPYCVWAQVLSHLKPRTEAASLISTCEKLSLLYWQLFLECLLFSDKYTQTPMLKRCHKYVSQFFHYWVISWWLYWACQQRKQAMSKYASDVRGFDDLTKQVLSAYGRYFESQCST